MLPSSGRCTATSWLTKIALMALLSPVQEDDLWRDGGKVDIADTIILVASAGVIPNVVKAFCFQRAIRLAL